GRVIVLRSARFLRRTGQHAAAETHRLAAHIADGEHHALAEPIVIAVAFVPFSDQSDLFQQVQRMLGRDGLLYEPLALRRWEAESEFADGFAREAALTQVDAGGFGQGRLEQAFAKLLAGPSHHVKHRGARRVMLGELELFQRDSGPPRQKLQRFRKTDMLHLLDKGEDIAMFATRPTAVALAARADVETGTLILVKRAQALEGLARRAQAHIAADDVHDVVGFFHLLREGCPVVRQGPPKAGGSANLRASANSENSLLLQGGQRVCRYRKEFRPGSMA